MELKEHNFKKKFGQNFIVNDHIIDNIITGSNIENDSLIIEIGPGGGALTKKLSEKANQVIAYEIDLDLQDYLKEKFKDTSNVKFIFNDFLKCDISQDIQEYDYKKIYVIANIPYYITTPIIEKLIASKIDIDKIVLMVQKEVGDRFSAKKGSKDYSSITVFLNYYFEIHKLFKVSRNNFYPRPKIDSVVISLEKRKDRVKVNDEKIFFKLIRDSFQFKRKNLRNNLKGYDLNKIERILKKYNMDLNVRAEALDIEIFADISNNI